MDGESEDGHYKKMNGIFQLIFVSFSPDQFQQGVGIHLVGHDPISCGHAAPSSTITEKIERWDTGQGKGCVVSLLELLAQPVVSLLARL